MASYDPVELEINVKLTSGQGRRRRGGRGVLTPALLKTGDVDPPDSRMKWSKSGVSPIFRVFWGRLATLPTI